MSEWQPIELIVKDDEVRLVYSPEDDGVYMAYFALDDLMLLYGSGWGKEHISMISHWMSLPEPPIAERNMVDT